MDTLFAGRRPCGSDPAPTETKTSGRRDTLIRRLRPLAPVVAAYLSVRVLTWAVVWIAGQIPRPDGQMVGGLRASIATFASSWDGAWYADIVRYGYDPPTHPGGDAFAFFPLYPAVGALFRLLSFGVLGPNGALLLVNLVAGLAGVLGLRAWVAEETGDPGVADRAAQYVSIFPSAVVLAMSYSEGLFLLLSVWTLWAARRQAWRWAAVGGALATLARIPGVLLIAPVAVEAARGLRGAAARERVRRAATVAVFPVTLLGWLLYVRSRTGDLLFPLHAQKRPGWRGSFVPFWSPLWRDLSRWRNVSAVALVLTFIACAFLFLAVAAFRRLPFSIALYGMAYVMLATSASNQMGTARYLLVAVPVFWLMAHYGRQGVVDRIITGTSLMLLGALAVLVGSGRLVP